MVANVFGITNSDFQEQEMDLIDLYDIILLLNSNIYKRTKYQEITFTECEKLGTYKKFYVATHIFKNKSPQILPNLDKDFDILTDFRKEFKFPFKSIKWQLTTLYE